MATNPLRRSDLDVTYSDNQGWMNDGNNLLLHQNCHPDNPILVHYIKSDGTVRITCSVCGQVAYEIQVAY